MTERLEAGAIAAWEARFGSAPSSVSCFPEAGVLSRDGWAWRMAEAVLHDRPLPRLQGDDWDYQEIARHVQKAMAA